MARQRKSLEGQIDSINEQISKAQDRLSALLEQKEILLVKKREEEIGELYELIKEKGMSVQDVCSLIGNGNIDLKESINEQRTA